ncbi:MAG: hypothetical protein JXA15_02275 [Spirochaetales bacterium]|nr:hypothetical protein [Spirochaetales bacterium]
MEQAAIRRWKGGRPVRAGKGKRIGFAPFLASTLVMLSASCGIPSYPFLAPPLAPTATPANYTFTFTNNPDTSPVFDGFILMYRIYERFEDIATDLDTLGTLDPEIDGAGTKKKLEALEFFEMDPPELLIDPAWLDESFIMEISFAVPTETSATAPVIPFEVTLSRFNGEKFDDSIDALEGDVEPASTGSADTKYWLALYACARGLDFDTINIYYSQFVKLGVMQLSVDTTD